jgi:nicotinate-nucleotide adenylyltransferase
VNVALFGGTFDPVHVGHIAAARAAMNCFALDQIHFVPASIPPHKRDRTLTRFAHRFAMIALACSGSPQFVPSVLEKPDSGEQQPNYSLLTIRKMAATLGANDRLFFIIGADAFLDVSNWYQPVALLDSCDFIIVSRPGFSISEIENVIPRELRAGAATETTVRLRSTTLHLLNAVTADVSSSAIRSSAAERQSLEGMVPDSVAEYIQKVGLYTRD